MKDGGEEDFRQTIRHKLRKGDHVFGIYAAMHGRLSSDARLIYEPHDKEKRKIYMFSTLILSQSSAAAEGARQGALIGTAVATMAIGVFWIWFLSFLAGPFLATQDPPDQRAFKTVVLATVIALIFGVSRIGYLAFINLFSAIPVYLYRRWRYRKAWIDTDLHDTFR